MSADNNNTGTRIEEPVKKSVVPDTEDNTATGVPIRNEVRGPHEWTDGDRAKWSTGLFDCFDDVPGCLDVYFCTPCMLSQHYNAAMYGRVNTMHWPLCLSIIACDVVTEGASAVITRGFPLYFIRKELRTRYHLTNCGGVQDENGNVPHDEPCDMWWDVAIVLLCTMCAMCQHQREMTARGEWPGKILFGSDPMARILEAPGSSMAV